MKFIICLPVPYREQRASLNLLKFLANDLKMSIVLSRDARCRDRVAYRFAAQKGVRTKFARSGKVAVPKEPLEPPMYGREQRVLLRHSLRYRCRPPVSHKIDKFRGIITARLAEYPRLTAMRLFEEICTAGYRMREHAELSRELNRESRARRTRAEITSTA